MATEAAAQAVPPQGLPLLELRLEPGAEGVIHLVAVAPISLSLSVASSVVSGRKYSVKLQGTQKNLPRDTTCRVLIKTGPAGAREDELRQTEQGGIPLKLSGSNCTLDLDVDLYESGLFGKGVVRFSVVPDFPFATSSAVTGTVAYDNPLDVKGALPGAGVLLGRLLQLKPVRGSVFANAKLRLSAFHAGGLQGGKKAAGLVFSIFEWPAGDSAMKEWRVGCAESDGAYLLPWLDTRKDTYSFDLRLELIQAVDEQEVAYLVWEKANAFSFPKPKLTGFELGMGSAKATVANVDPGFALPLELTLWKHELHDLDGVVRTRVMNPLTRPAQAVASASEYFWPLMTQGGAVPPDVFALLRIPRSLTGTDTYVPISAVMDYDDATFLPFDDDQLWLEPPPKGAKADTVAKQKKTAKELATAVASKELTSRPTRTPHFGSITPGVRDGNLLVSIKLVGDTAYWKDAKPTFSLRDAATQAEITPLTAKASAQNPHLHEAVIPLDDKRILGKKVLIRGAVSVPDAKLWNELCAAPPAFSMVHECVPLLSGLEMDTVELTDATTYLQFRCHARHIPNGKNGATLGFRLYEKFSDIAQPVELKRMRLRYDLPKGSGGQCDSHGRLVARITDTSVVERLQTQGRYRVEACVLDKEGKVLTFPVASISQEFGGSPRKTAGTIIFGMSVPDDFRAKVLAICTDLEMNPDHLMACMAFETGRTFKANKQNSAGHQAYGLIQFTAEGASALKPKKTLAELKVMTEVEQLDCVQDYMASAIKSHGGPLKTLSDVYMAILCPAAMGKPDTHKCYELGTKAYKANIGLDPLRPDKTRKGYITKADATVPVLEQYQLGEGLRK